MTTSIYQSSTLEKRKNTWKRKAQLKHNFFYYYPFMDDYVNNHTSIRIECRVHGMFKESPNHHLFGRGCRKCVLDRKRKTLREEFIEKSILIHGGLYDYSKVIYINSNSTVEIICPTHGSFWQTPSKHYNARRGCQTCGKITCITPIKTTSNWIAEVNVIHNYYDYSLVVYIGSHIKVKIICPNHGVFKQTPSAHLNLRQGCPKCSTRNYSKISIEWLDSLNLPIQHAETGGEYRITKTDNSYYKVDGYDPTTNTVYEFHGDVFHGNPKLFLDEEKCHPFIKEVTAKELYDKTIEREEEIKSLGYNLVVMWESDYIKI